MVEHRTWPLLGIGQGDGWWLQSSNFILSPGLLKVKLAKRLVERSFGNKVFFCNSGTEANEAAIKFARKWARIKGDPFRTCACLIHHGHQLHSIVTCTLSIGQHMHDNSCLQPAHIDAVWCACYAAGVDPYDKEAQAPNELVSFTASFHGRTLGALVLTYKVPSTAQLVALLAPHQPARRR